MKFLLGLMIFMGVLQLQAKEVTQQQLAQGLKLHHPTMTAPGSSYSPAEINAYLAGLEELEGILLTEKWLKELAARSAPTDQLRQWVGSQRHSSKFLTLADFDHPERQIMVVNIAGQAMSTLANWQTAEMAEHINNQWQSGNFDWSGAFKASNTRGVDAWERWIFSLPVNQLNLVTNHFVEFGIPLMGKSNRILAALIKKTHSTDLVRTLITRPADQYSYQVLQSLNNHIAPQAAVSLLQLATEHNKLQSQALVQLAKHYSDQDKVQHIFMQQLERDSSKWLAATIVTELGHKDFKQRLARHFLDKEGDLAVFMRSKLQEAEL